MTERWQTQLERIERLHPDDDLLERARRRPRAALPPDGPGRRAGAIAVAAVLTFGLAAVGYVVLSERGRPTVPVGSPDAVENGDLLFAADLHSAWHVYAVDPDTGETRELTDGVRDYGSDWSPDGTRIVYDRETPDTSEIVVADADGSDPVAIAEGAAPAWSPDGTRIAYSGPGGAIWVVNADGTDPHPVTDPPASGDPASEEPAFDRNAAWSPDGRSIAYTRVVGVRFAPEPHGEMRTSVSLQELRVLNEGGSDVVLTDAYTHLGHPDWSPDGSTIVFAGAPTLYHEETTDGITWPRLLTIAATGGEVTPITPERARWIGGATWSPDGEWIAFQDDYETIAIIRPDGSARREIDLGYEVIGLSWGVAPSASP